MITQFRESDADILIRIVDFANQRYLRQSRIHKKSCFNILRVLSAYKQTCDQYNGRKESIYNWILYITKHYNPQTLKQWYNAISEMNNLSYKTSNNQSYNQTITNINKSHAGYSKTINQLNSLIQIKDDYSDNGFNQHMSEIMPRRSNKNYTRNQSKDNINISSSHLNYIRPITSNMHYISFEPDHQNKQNISSYNNTKSELIKQDNQPTRTPIQQSFIHNLPLSYGSPFVTSKITNNTKQVTQIQYGDQHTQQWNNMKARADIFHQINLNMKAFSALLANFQAFDIFQQLYAKSKKFKKKLAYYRFLNCFDKFKMNKQIKDNYFCKAQNFYRTIVLKKSFKILNVLFQLKINQQNKKKIQINRFNRFIYQFLASIMFCPTYQEQQNADYYDTPKSIRHKSKHFQQMQDCQKIQMITQYFSCNLKLTKQQIGIFFQLRNKTRKQEAFRILKQNVRYFQQENKKIKFYFKKTAVRIFTNSMQLNISNVAKIKLMDIAKSQKIKQKCFKALFQYQMSKKIYAKRTQFLTNHHRQVVLKTIIKQWKNKNKQISLKKQGYQACVKNGLQKLKTTLCKVNWEYFFKVFQKAKMQQEELLMQRNLQICKQVFNFLKSRVHQRKIYLKIKQMSHSKTQKQIFKHWVKQTKICLSLHKLTSYATKPIFNQLRQHVDMIGKSNDLISYIQIRKYEKVLKNIRINHNLDKLERQDKIHKAHKYILWQQFQIFRKITVYDKLNTVRYNKNKQLQHKNEQLRKYVEINRKKQVLENILSNYNEIKVYRNKKQVIRSAMGNRYIALSHQDFQQKSTETFTTYTSCHKKLKKEVFLAFQYSLKIKNNQIKLQQYTKYISLQKIANKLNQWRKATEIKQKINKIQKTKYKKFINKVAKIAKKTYQHQQQKNNKAILKQSQSLLFKSLLSLAKATIYSNNLLNVLKNNISSRSFRRGSQKLITILKNDYLLKKKIQCLGKKLFLKRFRTSSKAKKQMRSKQSQLTKLIKLFSITKIKFSKELYNKNELAKQFQDQAYKKFAVMKVNAAVFRHILHKKKIYMAYKFRAIKICKQGFKGLFVNCSIKHYQQLAQSKKFRIHEHISTSYSSL